MNTAKYIFNKTLVVKNDSEENLYRLAWGKGSQRVVSAADSDLTALILSGNFSGSKRDWIDYFTKSQIFDAESSKELVENFIQENLLTDSTQTLSPAEEQWLDLGWADALIQSWAEQDTEWKHDYSSNPKVMTIENGENVIPTDAPPAPLIATPIKERELIRLPDPLYLDKAFIHALQERRTSYNFTESDITLEQISSILHWTFRAQWSDGVAPLRVTQSYSRGEPMVGYVIFAEYAPKGAQAHTVYQYDAGANYLVPISVAPIKKWSEFLWGQDFADKAPAGIVLGINWKNYNWKYRIPRSYRWAFTECGSFMQTALLASSALDIKTWETPAINDEKLIDMLAVEEKDIFPAYFLAIGK